MKQKDKDLLFEDLCGRLPYGVKVHAKYTDTDVEVEKVGVLSMIDTDTVVAFTSDDTNYYNYVAIYEVKPYLFPLSSMTDEQKREFDISMDMGYAAAYNAEINCANRMIDFFNKYHLDYRGFIPMGLAIDATGLNIY